MLCVANRCMGITIMSICWFRTNLRVAILLALGARVPHPVGLMTFVFLFQVLKADSFSRSPGMSLKIEWQRKYMLACLRMLRDPATCIESLYPLCNISSRLPSDRESRWDF